MSILFNGTDIESLGVVSNVRRSISLRDPQLITIPGMDGALLGLNNLAPATIEMDITVIGDPATREPILRDLGELLNTQGLAPLEFDDDDGKHLMATCSGNVITRYVDGATIESVTFTAPDPVMYGDQDSVTMASSSETITVGGNYPTKPRITCASATNGGGGSWGIQIDGGEFLRIELASSGVSVDVDCETRTAYEGSVTTLPTLSSDWLTLTPGSHTVTLTGTGYPTIEWSERWL